MLTNDDPGYVDLTSPAGIGIGALVYNYDGDVYASDEGRMLAEMGDKTFRLGNLHDDSYAELILSDALLDPLEESFALERTDVHRLRVRALLRRRSRLSTTRPGRLRRPQADLGVPPAEHGDLPDCCSIATRTIRTRDRFPQLGRPMIRSAAAPHATHLGTPLDAPRLAPRRQRAPHRQRSGQRIPARAGEAAPRRLRALRRPKHRIEPATEVPNCIDFRRSLTTSQPGDVVSICARRRAAARSLASQEPPEQRPAHRALRPLLPDVLAAAEDSRR